jgi:pimeloyl-ACP methyl ester carboxylesterase
VFASPLTRPLFRRLLFEQPEAIPPDYMRRFFDEYRRCSVFAQMFAIIDAAWFASLQPVEVPAALLWGEKERVLSVDQLDDYKALLPDHVVRTVPEWDHFPMIEQPAAYTREVLTLLNTHIVRAS